MGEYRRRVGAVNDDHGHAGLGLVEDFDEFLRFEGAEVFVGRLLAGGEVPAGIGEEVVEHGEA